MAYTEVSTTRVPEKTAAPPQHDGGSTLADLVLRFLLFSSCLVAVLVMTTSRQSELIPIPIPPFLVSGKANFKHSPAFIYFVAALSVVGAYAAVTTIVSFTLRRTSSYIKVISYFVIFDVLFLGIMAAATGAAGAVAYIGLKGNSHVMWRKICGIYDRFCRHIGSSIAVSLFGSILLALLIIISIRALSKRIPRPT